jgi:hypothetical protein
MSQTPDPDQIRSVVKRLRAKAAAEIVRLTQHAQREMVEENITLDEVLEAISNGQILEDYPAHRRGPCCLLYGLTQASRHLHIVCTTAQPQLIIITVYEPRPPKWPSPTQRSR